MKIYENGQLRDLTPKELEDIKAFEDEQKKIPNKPTLEEQILALQNALITSKISGGGITTITDSSENRIKEFSLIGKSEQVTTTGKNLFDIVSARNNDNYKPILGKPYELTAMEYDLVPNTDYVLSISRKISNPKSNLFIANDTGRKSLAINDVFYQTVNSLESGIIYVGFSGISHDTGIPDFESEYFDVQLEVGTSRTPYEPYTGGKPSPSPDHPQEIKSVGKWNETKQKYEVDVKVTGKNLFDVEFLRKTQKSWEKVSYYYIPLFVGKGNRISVSLEKDLSLGLPFFVLIGKEKGNDINGYNWLYHSTINHLINKKISFTAEHDVIYLNWSVGLDKKDRDSLFENIFDSLQIEISDAPTEYQPYTEQILTLTSDSPITKWDKLVEQDGQIGWLYQSAIKTFKDDVFKLYSDNEKAIQYQIPFEEITGSWEESVCYCNTFENVKGNLIYTQSAGKDFYMGCMQKAMVFSAKTKQGIFASLEAFQQWIRNSDTYVLHKTNTTEFVPLQQSEQDAIRALKTYYPTTVVSVDGGEVYGGVEVTYTADTKNYIDNKIKQEKSIPTAIPEIS